MGQGDLANPGVQFRDMIRSEIGKQLRVVDQVSVGVLASLSVGPEVVLDGMAVSVPVMWASPTPPVVGQRVVCVALVGGQQWIVISVVGSVIDLSQLTADLDAAEAAIVVLDGRLDTAETDIGDAETAIVALDGRLDTAETDIASLEGLFATPGYLFGGQVTFTASGSFTKGSYPGLRAVRVRVQGSGAGGGGGEATASNVSVANGGGGGGYAESFILVSDLDTSEAVTVGAGGAGNSGAAGDAGNDSVFDTISGEVRGNGGTPGASQTAGTSVSGLLGAVGGGGTGGIIIPGSASGPAWRYSGGSSDLMISNGGDSHLGSGGRGRLNANGEGGNGYGGGGGGGSNGPSQAARSGGAGSSGVVIVDLFF